MPHRSPERKAAIHGVYVAAATPRKPACVEADAAALLDYLDCIVQTGVDGILLFGSTGEFTHFDIDERMRVLSLAVKRSRAPLAVNVSHSSFAAAVDLAENAVEAGAAAVFLMPPYFFRYTDDQIFWFYQEFAKTIGGAIPIYLYNIPFFTNPLSAGLMERLLCTEAFAGIKDSSGDWALYEAIHRVRETVRFQHLIGNDAIYVPATMTGADGIVSGVAAAIPELIVALHCALDAKDESRVRVLDKYLHEFLDFVNRLPATIAIKQAAVARGWKQDHSAIPVDPAAKQTIDEFRRWLDAWLPEALAASASA